MVLMTVEKFVAAVIEELKLWWRRVLDAIKTMLHRMLYISGLRRIVPVHSRHDTCVPDDLQQRPRQAGAASLEDFIFCGASRLQSLDFHGETPLSGLIASVRQ